MDLGVDIGAVGKSGAWYSYGEGKIGQGKANTVKYLAENPDIAQEIENRIRQEKMGNTAPISESHADDSEPPEFIEGMEDDNLF